MKEQVAVKDLTQEEKDDLMEALLERLQLKVMRQTTPDYSLIELHPIP